VVIVEIIAIIEETVHYQNNTETPKRIRNPRIGDPRMPNLNPHTTKMTKIVRTTTPNVIPMMDPQIVIKTTISRIIRTLEIAKEMVQICHLVETHVQTMCFLKIKVLAIFSIK
jgi:hypothetical protein